MTTPSPAMLAWLRRASRSSDRERLVLRGSLVTAAWCPERRAVDVDHLVPGPCDLDGLRAIVAGVLRTEDAVPIDDVAIEVIWAETELPGLRVRGVVRGAPLQVDLGFGDPLVAPPEPMAFEGCAPIPAVTAETMFGWKVHGLFEHGKGTFRPKDLLDLWLVDRHVALDDAVLVASVRLAFESRGVRLSADASDPVNDEVARFVRGEWGRTRGSRRKWEWLARKDVVEGDLPPFDEVRERVWARVAPLLARLRT